MHCSRKAIEIAQSRCTPQNESHFASNSRKMKVVSPQAEIPQRKEPGPVNFNLKDEKKYNTFSLRWGQRRDRQPNPSAHSPQRFLEPWRRLREGAESET